MAIKDMKAKITLLRITSLLQAIPAFILVIPIIPFLGIGFYLAMVVIVAATVLYVVRNTKIWLYSTDSDQIEG